jgi:alkanesulfonate monooxygenase SsuD/methylene tetrahydromethanopterin reductase-like flavin-dependent oxidoreductase (luciferase family)
LEQDIRRIRARVPIGTQIQVTASGPKGAAAAGRVGDAIVIAQGDDAIATNYLAKVARQARKDAGITTPLEVWVMVSVHVVEREADLGHALEAMLITATATTRFAFAFTFDGKNVPQTFHAPLRERLARYTHQHHGSRAGANPNRNLFDGYPELREYLMNRMVIVGTRDQCGRRIEKLSEDASLDGIWLSLTPPDGVGIVRRAGEALRPLLK